MEMVLEKQKSKTQRTIDLLSLKEATARSAAAQPDIDRIAREANTGWWEKNRSRYIE